MKDSYVQEYIQDIQAFLGKHSEVVEVMEHLDLILEQEVLERISILFDDLWWLSGD